MKQANAFLSTLLGRDERYNEDWKRLCAEIKRTRGTACQSCKRGDVATRVHSYAVDAQAVTANNCVVLCGDCQGALAKGLRLFRFHVMRRLSPCAFDVLNGALAVGLDNHDPLLLTHAIAEMCASPASVQRFANAWEKPDKQRP
jgi:hypothetical protein